MIVRDWISRIQLRDTFESEDQQFTYRYDRNWITSYINIILLGRRLKTNQRHMQQVILARGSHWPYQITWVAGQSQGKLSWYLLNPSLHAAASQTPFSLYGICLKARQRLAVTYLSSNPRLYGINQSSYKRKLNIKCNLTVLTYYLRNTRTIQLTNQIPRK